MSVLVEFAIFPTDKGESKSPYVARVLDVIDRSGLPYRITPMGTIVEASTVREGLDLIERAYGVLEEDCNRIYGVIKIDYRKGPAGRLERKIDSVEEKLGRKLNR
ncbi:MTH1187 family thiamine-binding protein [Nitratifractor sp.]